MKNWIFLGVVLNDNLAWKSHISFQADEIIKSIGAIFRSSFFFFQRRLCARCVMHWQFHTSITVIYNHGQKSWDKLPFVALFHTRQTNSSTLVQPLPLPHPTMLDMCTRYFSRVSTLYWGVEGGATHFKTGNSAFLKLRFKNTEN